MGDRRAGSDGARVHFAPVVDIVPVSNSTRYDVVKRAFEEQEQSQYQEDRGSPRRGGDGGRMADDLRDVWLTQGDKFLKVQAAVQDLNRPELCVEATKFSWWILAVAILLIVIFFVILLIWVITKTTEQSKLFVPKICDKYCRVHGKYWYLTSGAILLEYFPRGTPYPPANPGPGRTLLFLHGNSENLDAYAEALHMLWCSGYRVMALEYAGYGITRPRQVFNYQAPSATSLEQDLIQAWSVCGSSDAIVMGFSLGGGLLATMFPYLCPAPAQLVFLNTFADFPCIVEESLPTVMARCIQPFLSTQWRAHTCNAYCGHVLVVCTADDEMIPKHHSEQIARQFRYIEADLVFVELADGGHRDALFKHSSKWLFQLLSA